MACASPGAGLTGDAKIPVSFIHDFKELIQLKGDTEFFFEQQVHILRFLY
jgi:hypothetical protein